jgi:hypothetical protein
MHYWVTILIPAAICHASAELMFWVDCDGRSDRLPGFILTFSLDSFLFYPCSNLTDGSPRRSSSSLSMEEVRRCYDNAGPHSENDTTTEALSSIKQQCAI